jgi:hypothetical protein
MDEEDFEEKCKIREMRIAETKEKKLLLDSGTKLCGC